MGFCNCPDVTRAKVDRENGCIIVDMEKLNTHAYEGFRFESGYQGVWLLGYLDDWIPSRGPLRLGRLLGHLLTTDE
ncbi:uncharacterized protein EAE98_002543 [Botrytis deweyae]|uniref:Uncharacterized protein n=1 Tax=Botrytis deweyae TaxID=2478750 RepID=A0ABQ7IXH2_9HELO|nr:uncharacterized protein EAE98_002543 [Botrytis deweyae]KAF7936324.1 hypothetical protein EAE98_002543 [Botrytis deweyae]